MEAIDTNVPPSRADIPFLKALRYQRLWYQRIYIAYIINGYNIKGYIITDYAINNDIVNSDVINGYNITTISTATLSLKFQRVHYQRLHDNGYIFNNKQSWLRDVVKLWVFGGGDRHKYSPGQRRLQDPVLEATPLSTAILSTDIIPTGIFPRATWFTAIISTTNSPYLPDGVKLWVFGGGDRHKCPPVPRRLQDPMRVSLLPLIPPSYTVDNDVKRFRLVLLFLAPDQSIAYNYTTCVS